MKTLFLLAIFAFSLALSPLPTRAAGLPVENDFASFELPAKWGVVESRAKNVRKPTLYLRHKYKVTTVGAGNTVIHVYEQDLPEFRGKELPLSEIDAAFERVSQLSGETTFADEFIPNLTELETSTGTLLGKPSRDFSFWMEPVTTKYFVRLSYASFGGKLYGLELVSLTKTDATEKAWETVRNSLKSKNASSSVKAAPPKKAKIDRSSRGERVKLRLRERMKRSRA